ncbi:hypothetical protein SASPL_146233 [Salvia splendens]|uniref:RNI-like superfamily protein n=1 Tax=Salvia splendens TaxID=180675 RepID=A0A8X8WCE3_SALSN|nr:hypothetical protein SASPL_146233 [Salvia splendens]
MEKGKSKDSAGTVTTSLRVLHLDNHYSKSTPIPNSFAFSRQSQSLSSNRRKAPALLSLCLGVVGCNLEDIIDDFTEIAIAFPSDIKLLNDDVLIALADSSWEILDVSGSDVSDSGLCHVVTICHNLKAIDIRLCTRLTPTGVSELLQRCHSLEILRWGNTSGEKSYGVANKGKLLMGRCLSLLEPNLNDVGGDSWEDLDAVELIQGASLRWLVWPTIDKDSQETLTSECPRIVVNPKPSLLGYRGTEVPREAAMHVALDDAIVEDIDPKAWAVSGCKPSRTPVLPAASPNELSIAEKFRLAFLDRDTRLAPKRAKNTRQHQRRAEREWVTTDMKAKALALASKANKSMNHRNL